MNHSLNQVADQILNAVYAGLKGPSNFSISRMQIKDEISQMKNRFLQEMVAQTYVDPEPFRQTIPKITLTVADFSEISGYDSDRSVLHGTIPEIIHLVNFKSVGFVTDAKREKPWKVIIGDDFLYHQYDTYSAKKPTALIQDTNLWIFNPPIENLTNVAMRAAFENPRALNGLSGVKATDNDPYPCPGFLLDKIRTKLVNDYLRQYRLANPSATFIASDSSVQPQPTDQ